MAECIWCHDLATDTGKCDECQDWYEYWTSLTQDEKESELASMMLHTEGETHE